MVIDKRCSKKFAMSHFDISTHDTSHHDISQYDTLGLLPTAGGADLAHNSIN